MPRDEFFEKKKENQEYDYKVTSSLEASVKDIHERQMENRRIGEENYDENSLTMENTRIMNRLKDNEILPEISNEMRERMKARDMTRLTRNNSILLYGDKKGSKDSDLMGQIKDGIKDLDTALRIPMKNGPEELYGKYDTLIGLMDTYVNSRHSMFPEGKRRKAKVSELKKNLTDELARLRTAYDTAAQKGAIPREMSVAMDVLEGRHLNQNEAGEAGELLEIRSFEILSLKHSNGAKDGKEMNAVKEEYKKLMGFMEGKLEEDPNALQQKKNLITKSYKDLITKCSDYIVSHDPKSAEGKMRLREIQRLKERSELEYEYISTTATAFTKKKKGATWKEVFGQVTVMAEECISAKKKTEVLLGERPPVRKMLNLFQSMTALFENEQDRYVMLPEVVMIDWLQKHIDKDMIDDIITERFLVMDSLATKYKTLVEKPVPKEYLKKETDDPMDLNARKDYARLVITADPAFKTFKMLNSLGTTLEFGLNKDKTSFKNINGSIGEYFESRGRERKAAMSENDRAYVNETGQIAEEIIKTSSKNLNKDVVEALTERINKAEYEQSKVNLKTMLYREKMPRYLEFEDPKTEQANIQSTMNVVRGKAFVPVQRPSDRVGTWSKVKNRLMVGYRFLLGSTIGTVASLVLNTYQGAKKLYNEGSEMKKAQETRRHDMVPGKKGEFFEEEAVPKNEYGEDTEVYSDTRRGPLIFEKLSAGDPEDPPEVTIMIDQSKRGSNIAVGGGDTHSFLGLSYSRYNRMTKRKERYQLRIGFFQGGGLAKSAGLATLGGAMIAGQIMSDYDSDYDVARRYQVKPGDINKILRAVEKYADKGYGTYKRNCTTFVVDMAKLIDLPVAKDFKEDEITGEGKMAVLSETGVAMSKAGYYMGANAISKRMNKMDMSYQNFGQKMFTKEDLKRYYKTAGKADVIKKGYNPGAAGETLRNAKSGDLTAFYLEHRQITNGQMDKVIRETGDKLWQEIEKVLPEGIRTPEDQEICDVLLAGGDGGLAKILNTVKKMDQIKPAAIRDAHKRVRNYMKKLNTYYANVLGNDASLNAKVMEMLSLYETTLFSLDDVYDKVIAQDAVGDAGKMRSHFTKNRYRISFRDKSGQTVETKMTPGVYEGYLLIGKTPEQAIKERHRLDELSKKVGDGTITKKEKAEWNKLLRTYHLASDFASANRYMLEKESYSDKDINYAFSELPAMERAVKQGEKVMGDLVTVKSTSATYQGVILERVFGGFQELKLNEIQDKALLRKKIDDYTEGQMNQNSVMAEKILRSYINGKEGSPEVLAIKFMDLIGDACVDSAYEGVWSLEDADSQGLSELLEGDSKLKSWLVTKINAIQNGEV